jgi:hypothetical protein
MALLSANCKSLQLIQRHAWAICRCVRAQVRWLTPQGTILLYRFHMRRLDHLQLNLWMICILRSTEMWRRVVFIQIYQITQRYIVKIVLFNAAASARLGEFYINFGRKIWILFWTNQNPRLDHYQCINLPSTPSKRKSGKFLYCHVI